jgi:hypothetical protein
MSAAKKKHETAGKDNMNPKRQGTDKNPPVDLKIGFTDDFLLSSKKLPNEIKGKAFDFIQKFFTNPRSSAIHYEPVPGAKDDKVRSARVDQDYRAIILHPEKGNTFMLVWVDIHDKAYAWAKSKTFDLDEPAGCFAIMPQKEIEQVLAATNEGSALLSEHDDTTLMSFGVPQVLIPSVRAIKHPEGFQLLKDHLSSQSILMLKWLAHGFSVDDVRKEFEEYSPEKYALPAAIRPELSVATNFILTITSSLFKIKETPSGMVGHPICGEELMDEWLRRARQFLSNKEK